MEYTFFVVAILCFNYSIASPIFIIPLDPVSIVDPEPSLLTFNEALQLYDKVVHARDSCLNVKDRILTLRFGGNITPRFPLVNCVLKPHYNCKINELTSALQHLRKDLDHLQEMWPVLLNVINYENSINNSDILLLLYFNSCKEKVKVVINSLQNTFSDSSGDDASGLIAPGQYDFTKPARCSNCTSFSDQYYNMYELHELLQFTLDNVYCIKETLNPNH